MHIYMTLYYTRLEFLYDLIREYFGIKSLYKRLQDCVVHVLVEYDCMNRLLVSKQWPVVELGDVTLLRPETLGLPHPSTVS